MIIILTVEITCYGCGDCLAMGERHKCVDRNTLEVLLNNPVMAGLCPVMIVFMHIILEILQCMLISGTGDPLYQREDRKPVVSGTTGEQGKDGKDKDPFNSYSLPHDTQRRHS